MKNTIAVATFAFILNENNEILLLRRAQSDSFPGTWEFPGGGLDYDEHPEVSIEREVMEEAGLKIQAVKPISVITHKGHHDSVQVIRITYECKLIKTKQKIKLSPDHDSYRWVKIEELFSYKTRKDNLIYYVIEKIQENHYHSYFAN